MSVRINGLTGIELPDNAHIGSTSDTDSIKFPANGSVEFTQTAKFKDSLFVGTGDIANSNKFNDYETGTWTPAYEGITATYTSQTGRYTKIGRLVFLQFYIATSAITMAGDYSGFQVNNLPFTSNSSDWNTLGNFTAGLFGYDAFSTASGTQALDGDHNDVAQGAVFGGTIMLLTEIDGTYISYNDVGNSGTTHFTGSCMYTTDS